MAAVSIGRTLSVIALLLATSCDALGTQHEEGRTDDEDLRLFITGSSNSLIVGNPPMFAIGLFALLVGGSIIVSILLGRAPSAKGADQSYSPYDAGLPSYERIASEVRRVLERSRTRYEEEGDTPKEESSSPSSVQ